MIFIFIRLLLMLWFNMFCNVTTRNIYVKTAFDIIIVYIF